ncbi:unnamed protein product [Brachionus calyciflorus]|uniref:rRNA adenine N(6)-methyltransferase n=1 Tax=Brachionus calyciflorus TaxID=104777 RepID=A0A814LKX4_9BILA|nr:unnamed protein product [Brachionus calyciflorus]
MLNKNLKNFFFINLNTTYSKHLSTHQQRILTQKDLIEKLKLKNTDSIKKPSISQKIKQNKTLAKKDFTEANKRLELLENKNLIYKKVDDENQDVQINPHDEKEYLKQASFKLRNETLDEKAKEYLDKMPSLLKTSTDPKHLTIIHQDLVKKVKKLIEQNTKTPFEQDLNVFAELNPGFGLVTKEFLENNSNFKKFLLFEPLAKFNDDLIDLKNNYSTQDIHLLKYDSFSDTFLFGSNPKKRIDVLKSLKTDDVLVKDVNLNFYGILPWNCRNFLNRLFTYYCSNTGFFGLNQFKSFSKEVNYDLNFSSPEFFLYVPEFIWAKLNPFSSPKYSKYKNRLSVFSSILTSMKLLDTQPIEYFFPYPIMSKMRSHTSIENKKMYLIHLKFKEKSLIGQENKRLFYLFVTNLYCHRNDEILKNVIKSVCKDTDELIKQVGFFRYSKIRDASPYLIMKIFNFLMENKELSQMEDLLINSSEFRKVKDDAVKTRNKEIKVLKDINKDLSGQFVFTNKEE